MSKIIQDSMVSQELKRSPASYDGMRIKNNLYVPVKTYSIYKKQKPAANGLMNTTYSGNNYGTRT